MKIVVAPDSYKGSLTAAQVGETIARALRQEIPHSEIKVIPMADGGEGTVDALVQAAGGKKVHLRASGPLGKPVDTYYGIIDANGRKTAVIEAGNICGLPMVPAGQRNPLNTTSRGLGEVMRAALDEGIRSMVIGLGGSATNDGGLGMLIALGGEFRLQDGSAAEGYGRELAQLAQVKLDQLDPRLQACKMTIACDVTNPLLGEQGATHVFGPQKGATPEQVMLLDQAMNGYANLVESSLAVALRDRPGAGAAGGLGFAYMALGAEVIPGAKVVEEMTGLRQHIAAADWVFTGEGRSDEQTLYGKLPFHVAQLAKQAGVKAILISGSLGEGSDKLAEHFVGCFSIVQGPSTLEACMAEGEQRLFAAASNIARLLKAASSGSVSNEKS